MSKGKPVTRRKAAPRKAGAARSAPAKALIDVSRALCTSLEPVEFEPPVSVVYNPLAYGRAANEEYLERFANRRGVTILLGMNPGPWGMAQTAVPFGAVKWVRDWMKLRSSVVAPAIEHPKRPVLGFDCHRTEVSGDRLWGWAADRYGSPETFFSQFFVWNYCPLSFMLDSGANLIPEKLPKAKRTELFAICDDALTQVVSILEPSMIVGIGKFAADRARLALPEGTTIGQLLHPSPASPKANQGWVAIAEKQLAELGVSFGSAESPIAPSAP